MWLTQNEIPSAYFHPLSSKLETSTVWLKTLKRYFSILKPFNDIPYANQIKLYLTQFLVSYIYTLEDVVLGVISILAHKKGGLIFDIVRDK